MSWCALCECVVICEPNVQKLLAHKFPYIVCVLFLMESEMRMFAEQGSQLAHKTNWIVPERTPTGATRYQVRTASLGLYQFAIKNKCSGDKSMRHN